MNKKLLKNLSEIKTIIINDVKGIKLSKYLLPVLIVGLLVLIGSSSKADVSFMDRVAQFTGQYLSDKLFGEVKDNVGMAEDALFGGSTEHSFTENFNAGLVFGGDYATSSNGALFPLTIRELRDVTLINASPSIVDATISFPASTTMGSLLPKTGDTRIWYIRNATTTNNIELRIASSTGVRINMGTTTNAIYSSISGTNWARVTLTRLSNTDFDGMLDIYLDK